MITKRTPTNSMTPRKIDIGTHIGERTHHHDHAIAPHSFRVMNTIVRSPKNPIPDELRDCIVWGASYGGLAYGITRTVSRYRSSDVLWSTMSA